MTEPNGIQFGKLGSVDLSQLKGLSRKDVQNNELAKSIFEKYDKNGGKSDGVLDEQEIAAMQKDLEAVAAQKGNKRNLGNREALEFMKKLGIENGSREDLYNTLTTFAKADSITRVDARNGHVKITYKGGDVLETLHHTVDGEIVYDEVVDKDGTKMQYTYGDDGKTVTGKKRIKGAVTETLDPKNGDRITAKYISGNGVGDIDDSYTYEYDDKGQCTETHLDKNSKRTVTVRTVGEGNDPSKWTPVSTTEIVTGEHTVYTTHKEGEDFKTRVEKDANDNVVSHVNTDADGNVLDLKYDVKDGESWLGIVEAKYGIDTSTKDGYKQAMEVVHQLKDATKGTDEDFSNYRTAGMPKSITLPAEMTLKDGRTVSLKNIDAATNDFYVTEQHIEPPKPMPKDKLPQKLDMSKVQIPKFPEFDVDKTKKAGDVAQVADKDGNMHWVRYADNGKVITTFRSEEDAKNNKNEEFLIGEYGWYNTFDESGRVKSTVYLNGRGGVDSIDTRTYSEDGKSCTYRDVNYDNNGTVTGFWDTEYEDGDMKSEIYYKPNGTVDRKFIYKRIETTGYKDSFYVRRLVYDASGNLESDGQSTF